VWRIRGRGSGGHRIPLGSSSSYLQWKSFDATSSYARWEGVDLYNLLSSSPRDLGLFTQHVVKERARICITALAAMPAGSTLPEDVSIKLIRDFRDELLALAQDMIRLPDGTHAREATFESLTRFKEATEQILATGRRDTLPLGMPRRMSLVYRHPSSPRTPAATLARYVCSTPLT
jgi:hypothetical protein